MKKLPILAATAAALLLAGCASSPPPGNPAVYQRISAETGCATLQGEFDTAERAHQRATSADNLDQMQTAAAYMDAADKRMRKVGCYH